MFLQSCVFAQIKGSCCFNYISFTAGKQVLWVSQKRGAKDWLPGALLILRDAN